jgi:hypothetical protein
MGDSATGALISTASLPQVLVDAPAHAGLHDEDEELQELERYFEEAILGGRVVFLLAQGVHHAKYGGLDRQATIVVEHVPRVASIIAKAPGATRVGMHTLAGRHDKAIAARLCSPTDRDCAVDNRPGSTFVHTVLICVVAQGG